MHSSTASSIVCVWYIRIISDTVSFCHLASPLHLPVLLVLWLSASTCYLTCSALSVHHSYSVFLSCSFAGLLPERTCTLVPTLPQSCRGFHVRCNNSGECSAAAVGGHAPDRSAVEARRAPGQAEHCRS